MDVDARLEAVEAENDLLREKIARLESLLGMRMVSPIEFGLTGSEARVFGVLMNRDLATRDAMMTALYANKADDDEAEIKIVDVFVCKMRKKLKPFGIQIGIQWGQGYYLTPVMKDKVRAMLPIYMGIAA